MYLSGNVVATGGLSGVFKLSGGSAGSPSLAFTNDTDTGLFLSGTNQMSLVTQGFARLTISAGGNVTMPQSVSIGTNLTVTGTITGDSLSGDISATDITSGTLPSGRITGSYTGISGVGTLNAGSITSGFGSIDIGADTIAAGSITSSGTITSSQSFVSAASTGILATTGSGNIYLRPNGVASTTGQLQVAGNGNVNIAGTLTTVGAITGPIAATNLTGTIASARLSGAYTGITQVGTLTELTVDNIFMDSSGITHASANSGAITILGGNSAGALVRAFGSTHATNPGMIVNDATRHIFRSSGGTNWFDLESTGVTLGTNLSIAFAGTGASSTRTNLGLGTLATQDEGTSGGDFRDNTANDARFMIASNNLSQLTNLTTARSNLGLGSIATLDSGTGSTNFRNNNQNDARFHISGVNTLAVGDLPVTASAGDWVQSRLTDANVGEVGTWALLRTASDSTAIDPGDNVAGSSLRYANCADDSGATPSGTWKCMGYLGTNGSSGSGERSTLFLRVA